MQDKTLALALLADSVQARDNVQAAAIAYAEATAGLVGSDVTALSPEAVAARSRLAAAADQLGAATRGMLAAVGLSAAAIAQLSDDQSDDVIMALETIQPPVGPADLNRIRAAAGAILERADSRPVAALTAPALVLPLDRAPEAPRRPVRPPVSAFAVPSFRSLTT